MEQCWRNALLIARTQRRYLIASKSSIQPVVSHFVKETPICSFSRLTHSLEASIWAEEKVVSHIKSAHSDDASKLLFVSSIIRIPFEARRRKKMRFMPFLVIAQRYSLSFAFFLRNCLETIKLKYLFTKWRTDKTEVSAIKPWAVAFQRRHHPAVQPCSIHSQRHHKHFGVGRFCLLLNGFCYTMDPFNEVTIQHVLIQFFFHSLLFRFPRKKLFTNQITSNCVSFSFSGILRIFYTRLWHAHASATSQINHE